MKALISCELCKKFENVTGIEAIPLYPYDKLDRPVSCHADMLFCVIDNTIFCYEDYIRRSKELENAVLSSGKSIIYVQKECDKKYPCDIGLNVLVMGKRAFCNSKHTAEEIIEYLKKNGYKIVDVKQGYSACSTLALGEGCAVTSDIGMKNALEKEGIEVLLISNKDIVLCGYNCGFIGGATAVIDKKVYFCGSDSEASKIEGLFGFLADKGYSIESFSSGDVADFGGIKLI